MVLAPWVVVVLVALRLVALMLVALLRIVATMRLLGVVVVVSGFGDSCD